MKSEKIPMRRCVGCRESKPKKELIRIAGYEGRVSVDPTGKAKGRGAYLCPDEKCLRDAIKKKAISRNIEIDISKEDMERLAEELKRYANNEEVYS